MNIRVWLVFLPVCMKLLHTVARRRPQLTSGVPDPAARSDVTIIKVYYGETYEALRFLKDELKFLKGMRRSYQRTNIFKMYDYNRVHSLVIMSHYITLFTSLIMYIQSC